MSASWELGGKVLGGTAICAWQTSIQTDLLELNVTFFKQQMNLCFSIELQRTKQSENCVRIK